MISICDACSFSLDERSWWWKSNYYERNTRTFAQDVSRATRGRDVVTPSRTSSLAQKNMYVRVPYGDNHLEGCLHGEWQPPTRELAARCASQGPEYEETQTYYVNCFRGQSCPGGSTCKNVRGRERLFTCPQNCEGKWETESHLPSVEQCVNDGRKIATMTYQKKPPPNQNETSDAGFGYTNNICVAVEHCTLQTPSLCKGLLV